MFLYLENKFTKEGEKIQSLEDLLKIIENPKDPELYKKIRESASDIETQQNLKAKVPLILCGHFLGDISTNLKISQNFLILKIDKDIFETKVISKLPMWISAYHLSLSGEQYICYVKIKQFDISSLDISHWTTHTWDLLLKAVNKYLVKTLRVEKLEVLRTTLFIAGGVKVFRNENSEPLELFGLYEIIENLPNDDIEYSLTFQQKENILTLITNSSTNPESIISLFNDEAFFLSIKKLIKEKPLEKIRLIRILKTTLKEIDFVTHIENGRLKEIYDSLTEEEKQSLNSPMTPEIQQFLSSFSKSTLLTQAYEYGWRPYQKFWTISISIDEEDGSQEIVVEFPIGKLINFLENNGFLFYKFPGQKDDDFTIVQIVNNVIYKKESKDVEEFISTHLSRCTIIEEPYIHLVKEKLTERKDIFLNKMTYKWFKILRPNIKRDDEGVSYVYFIDKWIRITSTGINVFNYEYLDHHVFDHQIIKRKFSLCDDYKTGEYYRLVKNVTKHADEGVSDRKFASLSAALGYLCHNYPGKNPYAIILIDEVIGETSTSANGGTAKSLILNSLAHIRPLVSVNVRDWEKEERFKWQDIKINTEIIHMNETTRTFDINTIFAEITDKVNVQEKFGRPFILDGVNKPKFCISTNYLMKVDGDSYKRRMYTIELGTHYNPKHTPEDEFGRRLFDGWKPNDIEWHRYDTTIIYFIQEYLKNRLPPEEIVNINQKRLRLLITDEFSDFMGEDRIIDWLVASHKGEGVSIEDVVVLFNKTSYKRITSKLLSNKIDAYCELNGIRSEKKRLSIKDDLTGEFSQPRRKFFYLTESTPKHIIDEYKRLTDGPLQ